MGGSPNSNPHSFAERLLSVRQYPGLLRHLGLVVDLEGVDVYRLLEALISGRPAVEIAGADNHYPTTKVDLVAARLADPTLINTVCNLSQTEANTLRAMKRDLFQLAYDRFTQFGETSLPKRFGTRDRARSEKILDWWEQWEHVDPPPHSPTTEVSVPGRPFDQQYVWDPNTGLAHQEPNPPMGPIVPADFQNAMAF